MDKLLEKIIAFTAPNVFNPWRDSDPLDCNLNGAERRCTRLRCHFDCDPEFVLVGEAPGYQGCHFSGVPFTNERLILAGRVPRVESAMRFTRRETSWSEPSATIVWNQLHDLGIADRTVMWNAFAWHPHKPGNPMSNRAPTKAELQAGRSVLFAVIDYFKHRRFVAVGNVAAAALKSIGVNQFTTVRHPSMGGANKFREQIAAMVRGTREVVDA